MTQIFILKKTVVVLFTQIQFSVNNYHYKDTTHEQLEFTVPYFLEGLLS